MKIAVVTGTRADYGLLAPVMRAIEKSDSLQLQLIVTGTHLLPEFGLTRREIVSDGFTITREIREMSSAGSSFDVALQVGAGTSSFARVLSEIQPSAVLLLGDRYEVFAAATAAFFLEIPIFHVHGGEITAGAIDDAIRHAISQFARVHAVAAPDYAERLVRAGAPPDSVHVVGGLGVDAIERTDLLSQEEIESELGFRISGKLLAVTYHPVTLGDHNTGAEIDSLLEALHSFPDATVVFTMPNADPEHAIIAAKLQKAAFERPKWHFFTSLGSKNYLSLLASASAVVGNSSSGLLEAPTLGIPTVNIGPRQDGRLLAQSVISCAADPVQIREALEKVLSPAFIASISGTPSPYGEPGAAKKILSLLEGIDFDTLGPRRYYDESNKL